MHAMDPRTLPGYLGLTVAIFKLYGKNQRGLIGERLRERR